MTRTFISLRSVSLALALLLLVGCGTTNVNYVTGEEQQGAYTWAQEVQLGSQADQQIEAQFGFYDDPTLNAYVERVAQDVLQTSAYNQPETPTEVRNTPFHFRILDTPVVNAFALPGGYVYVTRGLLAYLENEAQLAVVLGHEIGHVLGRHSSRRAFEAQRNQLGLIGAAVLGGVLGGGRVAEGLLNYGGTGLQLLQLKNSRTAEREADEAGVAYSEFAGYDATQAARFFIALRRLGEQSGQGGLPNFLSSHPDPGSRAETIPQLAAQYNPRGTEVDAAEYLQQIDGIIVGEDPRQGFTEDGVFYHPELRFRFAYPESWQTQNSPAAFIMGEPNGRAVIQLSLAPASSAQEAARELASQQGVQVSGSQALTIGSNRAYRVEGAAQQQNGALGFSATFIEYGGNVYQLLGITAANSFSQYVRQFRSVADSFSRLTDSRYLNRQPARLEVTVINRPSTIQSLLQGRTLPNGLSAAEVAIMNQVELSETIPTGTAVKLPE